MKISTHVSRIACGLFAVIATQAASATDLSNSVTGSVDGLPYRLFEPTSVPAGEKVPLILYLHGMGERGTDNAKQTTWINNLVNSTKSGDHAAFVLAPQIDTSSWFQSFTNTPTPAMAKTIATLKQVISTENVDTSRIYVTGVSMGGMGTWDILQREPGLFAAAVPMSGGGNVNTVADYKDTPIWAFHGSADTVVPVSETRKMIAALKNAGGNPKYTEVPGGGHTIWDSVYAGKEGDLYDWLFDQHLGSDNVTTPVSNTFAPAPVLSSEPDFAAVGSSPVPEPASIGGLAIVAIATLSRRRRRAI